MTDLQDGPLPPNWQRVAMQQICTPSDGIQTGPFGSQLHASDYVPYGVPLVMPVNIGDNRLVERGIASVRAADAERLARHRLTVGDIVMSRRGDVERRALVRHANKGWLCGTGCLRIRVSPRAADAEYVSFYLSHPLVRGWITRHAVGATMPNLNVGIVARVPVVLPPLPEQRAIASILGALDDKIDLNRRMSETLEAMARVSFDDWYKKLRSLCGEQSVQRLIDDGLLEIGDGYRAQNSEMSVDGLPFVRAGNLASDGINLERAERLARGSVKRVGNKINNYGDVAFTSKGTVGRITRVSDRNGTFVYSPQVCFWRSTDPTQLNPHVLYRWMKSDSFAMQLAAASAQTDMAPYVSLRDQRSMKVRMPGRREQYELGSVLAPIDDRLAQLARESRALSTLRDTLLPKLISGELRIPDPERFLKEVAA